MSRKESPLLGVLKDIGIAVIATAIAIAYIPALARVVRLVWTGR